MRKTPPFLGRKAAPANDVFVKKRTLQRRIAQVATSAKVPRRTLKTNPNDDLLRSLRAARRRMRTQWFFERFVSFALCAGLTLIVIAACQRWLFRGALLPPVWWFAAPAFAGIAAFVVTMLRRVDLRDVAGLVDRLGGTHDRSLTALAFAENSSPFQHLAAEECRAFLAKKNLGQLIPIRVPKAVRYVLIPIVTLALLHWESRLAADARQRVIEAAQKQVNPTAQQLEKLAKEIEKTLDPTKDEQLKKLAEQLRKSAGKLRAQENGADEAAKAALRELSNLEQMLQQMQKAPASASPEEMKQLAEDLAKNDATKPAADAMKSGDLAKAAKELEDAAKQPTKEEAEKTLREALDRLAKQRELSEAMQQLAKQLQQSGGEGASSDALQKLAQMLKQMGQQQGSSGKPGQQPTAEQLKQLMAALENMKFGEPQESGGNPQPGGDGKLTIQSFSKSNPDGSPPDGAQIPSGQPGGEHDTGTTETPFGKNSADPASKGNEATLKGRLGEGESLSQLLPTAGDTSKSARRYKQLYEAMAPSAEEAVVQENIPLGSRFLIKRYFESIRPKE